VFKVTLVGFLILGMAFVSRDFELNWYWDQYKGFDCSFAVHL